MNNRVGDNERGDYDDSDGSDVAHIPTKNFKFREVDLERFVSRVGLENDFKIFHLLLDRIEFRVGHFLMTHKPQIPILLF
jgi:hypothetical protein